MLEQHDFINVLDHWPGKGVGGDRFPMQEALKAARAKVDQLRNRRAVVLLGNNVARAFGARQFRYLEYYEMRHPDNFNDRVVDLMTIVPHPSGVNRYYNSQRNRDIVSKFLQGLALKE